MILSYQQYRPLCQKEHLSADKNSFISWWADYCINIKATLVYCSQLQTLSMEKVTASDVKKTKKTKKNPCCRDTQMYILEQKPLILLHSWNIQTQWRNSGTCFYVQNLQPSPSLSKKNTNKIKLATRNRKEMFYKQ